MRTLPESVYRAHDVRAADAFAIETLGVSGYVLMNRAGAAALDFLRECWPATRRVLVLCGAGNNGGDGYVLARLARAAGLEVELVALADPAALKGDAARAHADFVAAGGAVRAWPDVRLPDADVVVDALLGTGLDRPVAASLRACIEAVNAAGRPVLALDLPSGLHADTGAVLGAAVRAAATITFVGLKPGFWLGEGPEYTGLLACDDLDVPPVAFAGASCALRLIGPTLTRAALPRRPRLAHKGSAGRVAIVGGGPGMPGAVRLAAEAALRTGAGLVTVLTHPVHASSLVIARPEVICHGIEDAAQARPYLDAADVVALGPGLGQSAWARSLYAAVADRAGLRVLDADALNLLAQAPRRADDWVLTPHPGEAARLLECGTAAIQRERREAALELAARYGGIVVLKGAGSLIAREGRPPWVCNAGNPGMATAGMGDVLTGVIAGVLAQCRDPELAAAVGVDLHARAGDRAARAGERGLLASDLLAELRAGANP